jgi:hypothetical protein
LESDGKIKNGAPSLSLEAETSMISALGATAAIPTAAS